MHLTGGFASTGIGVDGSVRGTGVQNSAADRRAAARGSVRRATDGEEGGEDEDEARKGTTATPQREEGEERERGAAPQPADSGAGLFAGVTVNRPKRKNRGQPVYDQKKRRKTTHTAGKKKSTAQASQVDNGSGKGRVWRSSTR